MSRTRSEKRFRRRTVPVALLLLSVLLLTVVFGFQLKTVVVAGNLHNTPEEITDILLEKPTCGNTLLVWLFNRKRTITSPGFPGELRTEITGRDSLKVTVTEKAMAGRMEQGGSWWYFDSSGVVQAEAASPADGELVPPVAGLSPAEPLQAGREMSVANRNAFSMLGVLRGLYAAEPEYLPDLVEFDAQGGMTVCYGNVRILLGDGEKLEMRVRKMTEVLPVLLDGKSGVLHLENYDGSQRDLIFDTDS